jgi:hypothetical protein
MMASCISTHELQGKCGSAFVRVTDCRLGEGLGLQSKQAHTQLELKVGMPRRDAATTAAEGKALQPACGQGTM